MIDYTVFNSEDEMTLVGKLHEGGGIVVCANDHAGLSRKGKTAIQGFAVAMCMDAAIDLYDEKKKLANAAKDAYSYISEFDHKYHEAHAE